MIDIKAGRQKLTYSFFKMTRIRCGVEPLIGKHFASVIDLSHASWLPLSSLYLRLNNHLANMIP